MKSAPMATAAAIALSALVAVPAQDAPPPRSPSLDGTVELSAAAALRVPYESGPDASGAPAFGFEEWANLRLQVPAGDYGTVHAALNLVAASGEAALPVPPFVEAPGYSAAIELERLYWKASAEAFDAEAGLMRLAFGYGTAFSPSDFLGSRNPLAPRARPRGRLALAATAYPADPWKAKAFVVAPDDSLYDGGRGFVAGTVHDLHGPAGSLQLLGAFLDAEPAGDRPDAQWLFGLSAKLDAAVGVVLDAAYRLDTGTLATGERFDADWPAWRAMEASLGVDWSFLDGDVYMTAAWLFNGPGVLDPGDDPGELYLDGADPWYETSPYGRLPAAGAVPGALNGRHYAQATLLWSVDDYTRATFSVLASPFDLSFVPAIALEHEPAQGLVLAAECRAAVDGHILSPDGKRGELGPDNTGTFATLSLRATLRF
ncbi:MAG: hypothetical protein NT080_08635 [Spirochaetes bacterium]|nr:hypothetical protein [Spirochaetota bacterium]